MVLADRSFAPGEHIVAWDGRNTAGRTVASGVYLIRLESKERTEAQKVMLIK